MRVHEYFTGLASLYAAHRPGYPAEAMRLIVDGLTRGALVADIGCGTGISTRLLAAGQLRVVGIDPNGEMLAEARRFPSPAYPIAYCVGTGERVPLRTGSVDLVVCAQAFHWFDAEAALGDFRRILAPGGRLALMWNTSRRATDPFTEGYAHIIAHARKVAGTRGLVVRTERDADITVGGFFGTPQRHRFLNPHRLDWDQLLGRARSASYWPRDEAARVSGERRLRMLFDAYQHDGFVILQHITEVTIARPA